MNPSHKVILTALFVFLLNCFVPQVHAQSEATSDAGTWFKKADAELDHIYKKVLSKLTDKQQRTEFTKAEKAWESFRDADAKFRAGVTGGGSAYTMDYLGNLAEMTEARTKELRDFLNHLPPH